MDEDFVNTLLGVSWPIIPAFLSWLKGDTLWVRLPLAGVGIGVVAVVTTFTGLWSVSPVDIGGVAFLIMANWALGVISALRVLVRFASPGSWWFDHLYSEEKKRRSQREHMAKPTGRG